MIFIIIIIYIVVVVLIIIIIIIIISLDWPKIWIDKINVSDVEKFHEEINQP